LFLSTDQIYYILNVLLDVEDNVLIMINQINQTNMTSFCRGTPSMKRVVIQEWVWCILPSKFDKEATFTFMYCKMVFSNQFGVFMMPPCHPVNPVSSPSGEGAGRTKKVKINCILKKQRPEQVLQQCKPQL